MATFAVLDELSTVSNTILAETLEDAERITGATCVEYTETNPAVIGLKYADGEFEQPPTPVYEPVESTDNPEVK